MVSRLERGLIDALTIENLRAISKALEAPPIVSLGWRMPELERIRDRLHAAIVEAVCQHLQRHGWVPAPESGFNRYGDRGSADILAWHPRMRALLIVEVKSRVWDLQDLFSGTDRKWRVLPLEVRARYGWHPRSVGLLLVMPDLSTHRHMVASHRATFDAAFPARSADVRRWLESPAGDLRGVGFLPIDQLRNIRPRELRIRARRVVPKGTKRRSKGPQDGNRTDSDPGPRPSPA